MFPTHPFEHVHQGPSTFPKLEEKPQQRVQTRLSLHRDREQTHTHRNKQVQLDERGAAVTGEEPQPLLRPLHLVVKEEGRAGAKCPRSQKESCGSRGVGGQEAERGQEDRLTGQGRKFDFILSAVRSL